jgi:peroxin-16
MDAPEGKGGILDSLLQLPRQYEDLVVRNAKALGMVESVARTMIFLVPGRRQHNELRSEAVFAGVNLFALLNDLCIINSLRKHKTLGATLERKVPRGLGFLLVSALSVIHSTELFVEIFSFHHMEKTGRWTVIVCVEAVKAFVRLLLLVQNRGRMLIPHILPPRDLILNRNAPGTLTWSSDGPNKTIAELLYILRPLIYLWALLTHGRKSWRPWLLGIGIDIASQMCLGNPFSLSRGESEELTRRRVQLLFYLFRSPLLEKWAPPLSSDVPDGQLPLLEKVHRGFVTMVHVFRRSYFNIAGSS